MLVDLGRNDVGRVAKFGSVELSDVMVIERYSHVMHITSNVTGSCADGKTRSTPCAPACPPARSPARRRSGRCRSSTSWSRTAAAPTPARSATSTSRQHGHLHRPAHDRRPRATSLRPSRRRHRRRQRPESEYQETLNKARGLLKAVYEDGSQAGTLGGGCVEAEVKRRALGLLAENRAEVCTFQLDSDYGWDDGLICGGRMKILVEPITPGTPTGLFRASGGARRSRPGLHRGGRLRQRRKRSCGAAELRVRCR
jgi:hypothetical protein